MCYTSCQRNISAVCPLQCSSFPGIRRVGDLHVPASKSLNRQTLHPVPTRPGGSRLLRPGRPLLTHQCHGAALLHPSLLGTQPPCRCMLFKARSQESFSCKQVWRRLTDRADHLAGNPRSALKVEIRDCAWIAVYVNNRFHFSLHMYTLSPV